MSDTIRHFVYFFAYSLNSHPYKTITYIVITLTIIIAMIALWRGNIVNKIINLICIVLNILCIVFWSWLLMGF